MNKCCGKEYRLSIVRVALLYSINLPTELKILIMVEIKDISIPHQLALPDIWIS